MTHPAPPDANAPWPFPATRKIGNTVYVGLQTRVDAGGEIEAHTHEAFQKLIAAIESEGLKMADLMKLHTYYPYDGEGTDVTSYWERMTAVRLQYLADPGPAATALRVCGVWPDGPLIGVDGIADGSGKRTRIMPEHAWDWSVPTPFSQGWLVDDKIYVGGQISADRRGRAVSPDELVPQVRNTLEFIRHVLLDADAGWDDVVSIKVAYKCKKNDAASRATLAGILNEMESVFRSSRPALVCFGVDLLYEGLLLEIDATAVRNHNRVPLRPAGDAVWAGSGSGYPAAWLTGNEVHLGGQAAPAAGSLQSQAQATLRQIRGLLEKAGGSLGDLVKLNVYVHDDDPDSDPAAAQRVVSDILQRTLQPGRTVVSIVEVPGLMMPGQKIQIDGIAVLDQR